MNQNQKRDVTVGIVTYNSKNEISLLLDSLTGSTSFDRLLVFLVDNASADGTVEIVKKQYPWVTVIENSENRGFGKAHNQIIRQIKSRYHIMINPDVIVQNNTIEQAAAYMDQHPETAVLTPRVFNTDGTQQYLPKRNPKLKYLIGGVFENQSRYCRKLRDIYTMRDRQITEPTEVEFCTGAFMFARTDALQTVGGFDERYFLHFEDADLTRELRKVGSAIYHPDVRIVHKWHRENRKQFKSILAATKSMLIYLRKWQRKETLSETNV